MDKWIQGKVLLTSRTKRWTHEQWDAAEAIEKHSAYIDFRSSDEGRSRKLVAVFDSEEECLEVIENHNKNINNS